MWLLTLQLFKNSIDPQGKLKLNLHSLSVSVLLEYRRLSFSNILKHYSYNILNYLVYISFNVSFHWPLKTEKSRRVVESRPVCRGLY
jgi:hypothetical protein